MTALGFVVSVAAALTGCALDSTSDIADETTQAAAVTVQDGRTTACPNGSLCLYQNHDRGGLMIILTAGATVSDFRTIICPACITDRIGSSGTFDKQMSSWDNRSVSPMCYYDKPGFQGPVHIIPPFSIGNAVGGADNNASSETPCSPPGN